MQALVALLLPTHFLYAFLYYTDMGALTCIMASYLVGPTSSPSVSAVAVLRRSQHTVQSLAHFWHSRPLLWCRISVRPVVINLLHILTSVGIMYGPAIDEDVAMACC